MVLSGRITYRDPQAPEGVRPLAGVRVELWEKVLCPTPIPAPTPPPPRVSGPSPTMGMPCRDRLLRQTATGPDGVYTLQVFSSGEALDLYLVIQATDDRRVRVYRSDFRGLYFERTPFQRLGAGVHRWDVEIWAEPQRTAFFIYDTLTRRGWEELMRRVGWAPAQAVDVYWPRACAYLPEPQHLPPPLQDLLRWLQQHGLNLEPQSCYLLHTIFLRRDDGQNPFVSLHEFSHFVMDHFPGYAVSRIEVDTGLLPIPLPIPSAFPYVFAACASNLWNHDRGKHISPSCAWSEGWADFLAIALKGWDPQTDTWIEHPEYHPKFPHPDPAHPTNADSEWAVAAALWDLYDDLPEPWDRLADGLDGPARNGIWTLATQATPQFFLNLRVVIRRYLVGFYLPTLEGDRDGVEAFWAAWKAQRPETVCEAGRILTAHFIPHGPYPLTVHAAPPTGGTVSVEADRKCEDGTYPEGETVRLRAQPNPGWTFAGWIGAEATDPDGAAVVSMTQPRVITATFQPLPTPTPSPTPSPSPTPPPAGLVRVTELRFTHDASYSMPPPQVSGAGFSLVEVNPHYFELGSCALGRTCVLYRYQRADPISATPTVDLYLRWSWNQAALELGAQEPWVKILAFGGRWNPDLGRFDVDPAFQGVISGTVATWGWGATTRVDDRYRRIILELNQ